MGGHLHTPGHHGDAQESGAPDLSDDQGWAPAPTYPWASPFVINIGDVRSDVSLIPYLSIVIA